MLKMSGQQKSGAQKRKEKTKREEEKRGLRDFLNKYLKKGGDGEAGTSKVNLEQETVEFGSSVREDETDKSEIQLQSGDRENDAGGAHCPATEGQSQATGEREERGSHSDAGRAGCPVGLGESDQNGSETDHTLNFSDPALWPTRMTDSDRVNLVCVMAKRTPFSEERKSKVKGEIWRKGAHLRLSCPGPRQDCQLAW
ncbi:hypothetical protein UPYG_G00041300 [Umbra pygmaea]|uniref:Uncharacterized protein n=1 Tax=Umbra pygmaea TaxID=75934 RepID=A0ABD0XQ71_UMBPY